ncbi:hypothetical protein Q8F55_005467 [Vanrija albida]|uniref:Amino acid transporter transmembrane domain-containing protein n=1 Tax=Vanrija albida TaxID=181172 RepID=A0ABR3Q1Q3_9TREE
MFGKEKHSEKEYDAYAQDVEIAPAVNREGDDLVYDAVFGEISDSGPNYRGVGPVGSWVLITKANIGLGILGIPSVFMTVGLVPGILIILGLQSVIAYCGAQIGPFKRRHPEVYGIADAAYILGGRVWKEIFFVVFWINMVMVFSTCIVSISTAINAISVHAACTAIWMVVAYVFGMMLGSVRTLGKITWIGWAGLISLVASVLIVTIAVGVQDRPAAAPPAPAPWDKDIKIFASATFQQVMGAISTVLFSYGAVPCNFSIISEMRDHRVYVKSMSYSIFFLTAAYLIIGCVVYHYCGQYVSSPALGSAGPLLKKISYGIALPALIASLTLFAHIPAKHIFVRILSGSPHLTSNTPTHWITWELCILAGSTLGYILASAVPTFGAIIGLIGSVVVPLTAICPYPVMWWHDNFRFKPSNERTAKLWLGLVLNFLIFLIGLFIWVAGTWAAVKDIIAASATTGPWTCKDNSGSVKEE